jgi:hypothetical protein
MSAFLAIFRAVESHYDVHEFGASKFPRSLRMIISFTIVTDLREIVYIITMVLYFV